MALIVLHNVDSQGERAPRAFRGAALVLRVRFDQGRISNLDEIRLESSRFPGANSVVWVGHGAESLNDLIRGHPLTDSSPPRRIHSGDLIRAFAYFRPLRLYLLTCMAGLWVRRNAEAFADELRGDMSFQDNVHIYATPTRILGAAINVAGSQMVGGAIEPPGAFGKPLFEKIPVFEGYARWRQRVSPSRSLGGAWESPI